MGWGGCPIKLWATRIEQGTTLNLVTLFFKPGNLENIVLRFQSTDPKARQPRGLLSKRERFRVWLLLGALAFVIMAIRHLQKPSTVDQLNRVFSPQQASSADSLADTLPSKDIGVVRITPVDTDNKSPLPEKETTDNRAAIATQVEIPGISEVRDKTFFRPAEQEAWFHLIGQLQESSLENLSRESVGEITIAQLFKQPDQYRGKVISLHGIALREEIAIPAKNSLGLKSYHRLWIRPLGGGNTLYVVYCLKLPDGFPRGDKLHAPVSLTGYFFKNWSYEWGQDMALAPVLLTSTISWQPPQQSQNKTQPDMSHIVIAMFGASTVGILVAWLAYRNTNRPSRNASTDPEAIELPPEWQEGSDE